MAQGRSPRTAGRSAPLIESIFLPGIMHGIPGDHAVTTIPAHQAAALAPCFTNCPVRLAMWVWTPSSEECWASIADHQRLSVAGVGPFQPSLMRVLVTIRPWRALESITSRTLCSSSSASPWLFRFPGRCPSSRPTTRVQSNC